MTTTTKDLFAYATRYKLRFASPKVPNLTLEQLWDVPLRSKDDFNLDAIAQTAYAQLKAAATPSFVDANKNDVGDRLEMAFEIVKFVIETKKLEENEAKDRVVRAAEAKQIREILAQKAGEALSSMSAEALQKRLSELQGGGATRQ